MTDHLLSRREVAQLLKVPVSTLAQWAYAGQGPRFYRVGKHCRYSLADIQSWLESNVREPFATTP